MRAINIFLEKANPISLKFSNNEIETEFRAYYASKYLWQLRLAHVLSVVFFTVALLTEYVIIDLEFRLVLISLLVVIISFGLGFAITFLFKEFYKKYNQVISIYYVLITSASFIIFGYLTKEPENYSMYSGLFVCLIFNYTFIRQSFLKSSIVGFIVLAGFFVAIAFENTTMKYLTLLAILFSVVQFLGMFIAFAVEHDSRKSFLMLKQIKSDASEIAAVNENLERLVDKRTEELIIAKDKAEESDRLKSAFLANMSHEIRTPMNGILGFLDLLGSKSLSVEDRDEYMGIVYKSGERLLTTINDIIELSKIESGEASLDIGEVNIDETMNYLLGLFRPEAKRRGIELLIDVSKEKMPARIHSDSYKIEAIMTNLIKNALKFTDSGYVRFGCVMKEGKIVFFVKDSGIGIVEDRVEAVFDRFVQADLSETRRHEGSGLGLPICRAYAEMLGGRLWVDSVIAKGSSFYLSLNV